MKSLKRLSIDISVSSIFWILLTCGGIYLLFMLSDLLMLVVTALLIGLSVTPFVDKLEKYKVSRPVSSAIILLILVAVLVLFGISIATPLIDQTSVFIEKFPAIVQSVSPVKLDMNSFSSQFDQIPSKIFSIALGTFSGLVSAFTTLILSFYVIQEMKKLPDYINFWFSEKSKIYVDLAEKLQFQISLWVRGQLLLMLVVGILNYLGFLAIGLPYALPLAFIAGILELIPNIGPTLAAVPAMLVGFSLSPLLGVASLVVSIIVQQLENNFIVPKIMQKVAGLNPIITILSIMIGYRLGGPLLAILSIPLVLSIRVVYSHIRLNHITQLPEID